MLCILVRFGVLLRPTLIRVEEAAESALRCIQSCRIFVTPFGLLVDIEALDLLPDGLFDRAMLDSDTAHLLQVKAVVQDCFLLPPGQLLHDLGVVPFQNLICLVDTRHQIGGDGRLATTTAVHLYEFLLEVNDLRISHRFCRVLIEESIVLSALKKQLRCLAIEPTVLSLEWMFGPVELISLVQAALTILSLSALFLINVVIESVLNLTLEGYITGQVVYIVILLYHSD